MKLNLLLVFIFTSACGFAQSPQDTLSGLPQYRNIIRWNPTPLILFGPHYYIFGYERILNSRQSISFNTGFTQMPTIEPLDFDSLEVFDRGRKKYGSALAFDYRFYLTKRNKFNMPDGLYIGPYTGYYYYHNELEISFTDSLSVTTTSDRSTNLQIGMLGFELGYQFILWKNRLSIDLLLLGPAISVYNVQIELANDIDIENDKLEQIRDNLLNQFPKLKDVVSNGSFSNTGASFNFGVGFRYAVQIGFCF